MQLLGRGSTDQLMLIAEAPLTELQATTTVDRVIQETSGPRAVGLDRPKRKISTLYLGDILWSPCSRRYTTTQLFPIRYSKQQQERRRRIWSTTRPVFQLTVIILTPRLIRPMTRPRAVIPRTPAHHTRRTITVRHIHRLARTTIRVAPCRTPHLTAKVMTRIGRSMRWDNQTMRFLRDR